MPLQFSDVLPPQSEIRGTETTIDLQMDALPIATGANTETNSFEPYELVAREGKMVSSSFEHTPDFSPLEGVLAGFADTGVRAMYHGYDSPDFEYDPTFNSAAAIDYLRKTNGRVFSDSQTKKLVATGSEAEFNHQLTRFDMQGTNSGKASQELLSYIAGSLVDYDTLVPFGLGKTNTFRKMGKAARAATAGGTTAGLGLISFEADKYTPLSATEVAVHISVMTAASMLPEAFRGVRQRSRSLGETPLDESPLDESPLGTSPLSNSEVQP